VKEIILDKLRRLKLVWVGLCLGSMLMGFMMSFSTVSWMYLPAIAALVPNLACEFDNGYGRVLLSLPFTTRKAGRILWFVLAGIPALIMAVFGGVGILAGAMSIPTVDHLLLRWLELSGLSSVFFGSVFWIGTGAKMPLVIRRSLPGWVYPFHERLLLVIGGAIGYWLYHAPYSGDVKCAIVCALGLVLTIWGRQHAETRLVAGGERRQPADSPVSQASHFRAPTGKGGIGFLLGRMVAGQLSALLLVTLGVLAWCWLLSRGRDWSWISRAWPMLVFAVFIPTAQRISELVVHLRCLRTLPLTAGQIAGLFLLASLLPIVLLFPTVVMFAGAQHDIHEGLSVGKTCVLAMAPVSLLTAAAVWRESWNPGIIAGLVVAFCLTMIPIIYQLVVGWPGLSWPFIIIQVVIFLALAFWTMRYGIEHNDQTYHKRTNPAIGA